jgi:hypothetical protein
VVGYIIQVDGKLNPDIAKRPVAIGQGGMLLGEPFELRASVLNQYGQEIGDVINERDYPGFVEGGWVRVHQVRLIEPFDRLNRRRDVRRDRLGQTDEAEDLMELGKLGDFTMGQQMEADSNYHEDGGFLVDPDWSSESEEEVIYGSAESMR